MEQLVCRPKTGRYFLINLNLPAELMIDIDEWMINVNGEPLHCGTLIENDDRRCWICGSPVFMAVVYDSMLCFLCHSWLEASCSDPDCQYCDDRPERPIVGKEDT